MEEWKGGKVEEWKGGRVMECGSEGVEERDQSNRGNCKSPEYISRKVRDVREVSFRAALRTSRTLRETNK